MDIYSLPYSEATSEAKMGGCLSWESSSPFKNVRVVHLNGYVEDFEQPITVSQVNGTPSKHFVCTSAQLLLSSSSNPLKADSELQPGHIYFMLPYSILQPDVSPLDLASLSKKLTSLAKTSRCGTQKTLKTSSFSGRQHGFMRPIWGSSPNTSPARLIAATEQREDVGYGGGSPYRVRTWKPLLDTIGERSFNRGSESDLRERDIFDVCKTLD